MGSTKPDGQTIAGHDAPNTVSKEARKRPSGELPAHFVIILICLAALALTFQFDSVPPPLRRGLSPETFPRIVAGLAFVLTCLSLLRSLRARARAGAHSEMPPEFYLSVLGCLVFLGAAHFVDLLIAMSLFTAILCWVWGERREWLIIALSLALPFTLFMLFSEALGIRFPHGVLVDWIYG